MNNEAQVIIERQLTVSDGQSQLLLVTSIIRFMLLNVTLKLFFHGFGEEIDHLPKILLMKCSSI